MFHENRWRQLAISYDRKEITHDYYWMKRECYANTKEPHLSSILTGMATSRADDPRPTSGGVRRWEGHGGTRRGKQAGQCAHGGANCQSVEHYPKATGDDGSRRRRVKGGIDPEESRINISHCEGGGDA